MPVRRGQPGDVPRAGILAVCWRGTEASSVHIHRRPLGPVQKLIRIFTREALGERPLASAFGHAWHSKAAAPNSEVFASRAPNVFASRSVRGAQFDALSESGRHSITERTGICLNCALKPERVGQCVSGVAPRPHGVSGPGLSGTPARGAIPFSSFPEVFAALRPPATFCQPSGLGAYGGLAIVNFFTASTRPNLLVVRHLSAG